MLFPFSYPQDMLKVTQDISDLGKKTDANGNVSEGQLKNTVFSQEKNC